MQINKLKNGVRVQVKDFDNKITLINELTGEIVAVKEFTDHIIAVHLAKKLLTA